MELEFPARANISAQIMLGKGKWKKQEKIRHVAKANFAVERDGLVFETTRVIKNTSNTWKCIILSALSRTVEIKAQGLRQLQYLANGIIIPQKEIDGIIPLYYKFCWNEAFQPSSDKATEDFLRM